MKFTYFDLVYAMGVSRLDISETSLDDTLDYLVEAGVIEEGPIFTFSSIKHDHTVLKVFQKLLNSRVLEDYQPQNMDS